MKGKLLFEEKMVVLTLTLYGQMREAERLDGVIRANLEGLGAWLKTGLHFRHTLK